MAMTIASSLRNNRKEGRSQNRNGMTSSGWIKFRILCLIVFEIFLDGQNDMQNNTSSYVGGGIEPLKYSCTPLRQGLHFYQDFACTDLTVQTQALNN